MMELSLVKMVSEKELEEGLELYERALKAKTKLARNTLLRKSADLLGFDTIADLLDFFTIL